MAGMRLSTLSGSNDRAYCTSSLSAADCPSSQIAIELPVAVPLWKVKVGPRADKLYRTRKGPVFPYLPPRFVPAANARCRLSQQGDMITLRGSARRTDVELSIR